MKKIIGMAAAAVIVLGLSLVIYNQIIPDEYVLADDEIALHLKLDTEEDVGLLVYDYRAGGHEYSGGISNADGSLIQHDSDNIVVWNREELNLSSDPFELTMQLLQVGDLVFFGSGSYANHVGMYIGDGNFVHASTPSTGVRINSLNETYYTNRYIGARRIITG